MQGPDAIRLRHMLDAAREAISFVLGRTRDDLNLGRQLVLALVKSSEIVGGRFSGSPESCSTGEYRDCGEMWRHDGRREEVVTLKPGVCLTIPVGTSFQFRAAEVAPLSAFAVTMPPWPSGSEDEWQEVAPHWPV